MKKWGIATWVSVMTLLSVTNMATAKKGNCEDKDCHVYQGIIVGGGIAGLTAGFKLKNQDIKILEKHPGVGGRIWEGKYRGFSYARGAEYIGEPWGPLKKVIEKLKLKPVEVVYPSLCQYNPDVPGYEHIDIYNGFDGIAFMHVAEDGGDRFAHRTYNRFMREVTELLDDVAVAGEMPPFFDVDSPVADLDYVTMREWFEQRGFGYTYQDKWNNHTRGLFGANMDQVSILMAISELGWEYDGEEPIDMPDESWNEYRTDLYPEEVFTFKKGISALPKAIAASLGDKIVTRAVVKQVTKKNDIYTIKYRDRKNNVVKLRARSVVMAVPAPVALEIAPTLIKGKKRRILENIQYCEYLTVNLFSEEPIQNVTFELSTPGDNFVVAFYDSLWVQKWEDPTNELNDEVFITSAYIAGQTCGDALVNMSDEEIVSTVFTELDEIFPGASYLVTRYEINRFKYGYPLFGLGSFHDIQRLNELNLKQPQTFVLVGDYLALPTLEAAMAQAAFVAKILKLKMK